MSKEFSKKKDEEEREEQLKGLEEGLPDDEQCQCPLCQKELLSHAAMKLHYQKYHQGVTPFRLVHSSQYFVHSSRHSHQSSHVLTIRPHFSCVQKLPDGKLCKKYFTTRQHMMQHIQGVHEDKPAQLHVCILCNVNFSSKSAKQQHDRDLHGKSMYNRPVFVYIRPYFLSIVL